MKTTDLIRTPVTRTITLGASVVIGLSALVMAAPPAKQPSVNSGGASKGEDGTVARLKVKMSRAELPLSFEPNIGQTGNQVKFLSRGDGYELFLTEDEAVLLLKKSGASQGIPSPKLGRGQLNDPTLHSTTLSPNLSSETEQEQTGDQAVLAMRLVGANRRVAVTGLAELPGTSNYFIGNDSTKWHTNVPNYAKVRYEKIYPGVDLIYYGNQSHLEYDFVVAPGVDPGQIKLAFEGRGQAQTKLSQPKLGDNGDLVIDVDGQEVRFRKPFVYQAASEPGVRIPIEGRYVLRANHEIGFELGQYDRSKLLVIDPVLLYSTYMGGTSYDQGMGVGVDPSGNILLTGTTASPNFPTANAFQSATGGGEDVFVTKFNSAGTTLIYSTYLGGKANDNSEAMALDSSGDAYITGFTLSTNFPTLNAIQSKLGGVQNIFLAEISPTGTLLFSTYYGGSSHDQAYGIAVDSSGVYVAGNTTSPNYPTVNAFQTTNAGNNDAFLTKFATNGSSVFYSTFLGGAGGGTQAYSVAVDSSESPYVTGVTVSPSFPLMNPFQTTSSTSGTIFLTKFAPAGNALVYSTYFGGTNGQSAGSVAVDSSGNAYISGGTTSSNFPTQNAFQATAGGNWDVIVAKFNSTGSALIYSTYIGGRSDDFGDALAVDSSGNAYVAGYTESANFPATPNAFQPIIGGGWDAFVLELNATGNGLIYASYLGGSGLDAGDAITLDPYANVYVSGTEASTNFPVTSNAFQSSYGGGSSDAFLTVVGAVTTYQLTVSIAGTGTGTVTSSPLGINCGTICSTTFATGTVVLTANSGSGSIFTGWSGACSGTGTCDVSMTEAQSVTATFAPPVFSVGYNLGSNSGDPTNPTWPGIIAQGHDGNLYSTAPAALGGSNGAVFNVTPSGTLTVLTTFESGGAPQSGLILGTNGNFYGTTYGCSVGTDGTVFEVTMGGTLSTLYDFTGGTDGSCPTAPPIQGIDGNFYGTASISSAPGVWGSVYKITPTDVFTALFDFDKTNGSFVDAPLMQSSSGLLYGVTYAGGSNAASAGNVFTITTSGTQNVLFTFNGNDGNHSVAPLIQGSDGNFYGTAVNGGMGGNNFGVVFKITPTGTFTALHYFAGTGDGAYPYGGLVQASDGNYYGTTSEAAAGSGCGTIFRISNGNFQTIYTFPSSGSSGCNPEDTLVQHTSGILYGTTNAGGSTIGGACASGCGTIFSLNANLPPFITLLPTSGKVGSTVGILGQGFSSSSVVEFNGVAATAVTVTGSTYLSATVPVGASTGYVAVNTAGTTLTSTVQYLVHNSWTNGTPMPVAVAAPAVGLVNGNVYIVGGFETNGGSPVGNNQVYNPTTNAWTTAAAIPTPVYGAASAVVGPNLYVIGGYEGSSATPTNLVQVYNSNTNAWSTAAAMPTARGSVTAVLEAGAIYALGGNGSTPQLNNVEQFVSSTATWTEEAPLINGKSDLSAGVLGTTIVAADGFTASGDTGDNESYNVSTNTWSSLTADPNPRNASCSGAMLGLLYVAGGLNNGTPQATTAVNESYNMTLNKWTSLAPMPTAAYWQRSAVVNNLLYCFGGESSNQGAVINNLQIYQP
jgi:uncharacterized repeat protein (TIGR03803 family)